MIWGELGVWSVEFSMRMKRKKNWFCQCWDLWFMTWDSSRYNNNQVLLSHHHQPTAERRRRLPRSEHSSELNRSGRGDCSWHKTGNSTDFFLTYSSLLFPPWTFLVEEATEQRRQNGMKSKNKSEMKNIFIYFLLFHRSNTKVVIHDKNIKTTRRANY